MLSAFRVFLLSASQTELCVYVGVCRCGYGYMHFVSSSFLELQFWGQVICPFRCILHLSIKIVWHEFILTFLILIQYLKFHFLFFSFHFFSENENPGPQFLNIFSQSVPMYITSLPSSRPLLLRTRFEPGFGQFHLALALTALGCYCLMKMLSLLFSGSEISYHTAYSYECLACSLCVLNSLSGCPQTQNPSLPFSDTSQLVWNAFHPYSAGALIPHRGLFPLQIPLWLYLLHLDFNTVYQNALKCRLCLHLA